MLLRLFIIELEKLCSSCFLVEKYAKKRLECLGNVGWYINHEGVSKCAPSFFMHKAPTFTSRGFVIT